MLIVIGSVFIAFSLALELVNELDEAVLYGVAIIKGAQVLQVNIFAEYASLSEPMAHFLIASRLTGTFKQTRCADNVATAIKCFF